MTALRATLVIPSRDRAALLSLVLERLLDQTVPRSGYEIIVVDDGSTDDTPETLARWAARGVRSRRVARGGAARARNRALEIARGEVMLFLDDDALVARDFVARHLAVHDRHPRALAAGGIIEVREPHVPATPPAPWTSYHRHPMPGGNSSVRRRELLDAGGFDESFDTYGWQDQELAERLLARGLRRRFVWNAPIFHYKPSRIVHDARHELERELERGRMGARFYHKHPRTLVGITTKMWPPLRLLDRALDRALDLESRAARILTGELSYGAFTGLDAALLRAHVEITAGWRELERLKRVSHG